MGSWMGNLLRVELTAGRSSVEQIPEDCIKKTE